MAWDFLGDYKNDFMKSSLKVHTDLSGSMQYVGKTQNEKTLSPNTELTEWFDNTGSTQVLFALDVDKFDMQIGFSWMQVMDENTLSIAYNLEKDTSATDQVFSFMGSNPGALPEAEWRFTGQSVDGRGFTLVIRKGILVPNGDTTLGTPGSYAEVPCTLRALQDTSITNTKRDIGYFITDKRTFS